MIKIVIWKCLFKFTFVDETFGRFVLVKMLETFIWNTFVRASTIASEFDQKIVILNILINILLYLIGYCLHFNIITKGYRKIDLSSYKLAITIRNILLGKIEIPTIISVHLQYKHDRY